MHIRLVWVVMATAMLSAVAGAQPDKDRRQTKGTGATPASVVLASASDLRRSSATAADHSGELVRRPAPRVTTCRCADQQPSDQQPAEEQPDQ